MRRRTGTRAVGTALLLALSVMLPACDPAGPNVTPAPDTGPSPEAISSPSPATTEQPQATHTPAPLGDNKIDARALLHDSRDPEFRSPGGAVKGGTPVTLRLRTAEGDVTGASVRLWNSALEAESMLPMRQIDGSTWEAVIETPQEGAALWYRFIATDGRTTAYYYDDRNRDGGRGEGQLYNSDSDYVITSYNPDFKTPDWVRDAVVYQIFPDRFSNGDPANDKPTGSFIYGGQTISKQWGDRPTGGNDFFGGDLEGVTGKLDYLQGLGVTAVYFNPIFASPSNHRYDTTDFTQIEPSLGDLDSFKTLVAEAEERGIRVILDGVFSHSSSDSLYFDKFSRYNIEGAFESQSSQYADWYSFQRWPERYKAWSNIDTLPAFTETDEVVAFLFSGPDSIVRRWTREGIGGWRLDAAEQKGHDFWRKLRPVVKEEQPDSVIIGEFWHNSAPWLVGDQWDGTMNYRFRDALLGWLANPARNVETMVSELDSIREDYPPQALAASMNLIGSHDTERALTAARGDKNMLRLMALMQFTWPGMPTVYYGDEAGLEGARDPDDRRTYPWGSEDTSLVDLYRLLSATRHEVSALRTGEYINLGYSNELDVYAYARKDSTGSAVVGLNRSNTDRTFDIQMAYTAPDGTVYEDRLNGSNSYTVVGGKLSLALPARWGALLVQK